MKRVWNVGIVVGLTAWTICAISMVTGASIARVVLGVICVAAIACLVLIVWPHHDDREARR